jgi:hypothetical protein
MIVGSLRLLFRCCSFFYLTLVTRLEEGEALIGSATPPSGGALLASPSLRAPHANLRRKLTPPFSRPNPRSADNGTAHQPVAQQEQTRTG